MNPNTIKQRLEAYKKVDISPDLKKLTDKQKRIVENLIEAGKIADHIFWKQSSHDALEIRGEYLNQSGPIREYIEINYGPYDRLHNYQRFIGEGSDLKPLGAGFYPEDISREEFRNFVNKNPKMKKKCENQYTIVYKDDQKLKTAFYHQIYEDDVRRISDNLDTAASLTKNRSLKTYLNKRSIALRKDDYYDSDIAWMDLKNNLIDVVIGPIENYEDRLFNYKTAYEAAVMTKDIPASEELAIYKQHLNNLEKNLPIQFNSKKQNLDAEDILEIVNIVYFGGDFQAGVKTIAASLPNDEKVISEKGAKKQLYKNIMESKFENILIPIAKILIHNDHISLLSRKRFVSQVLLHEISHTIGPNYVIDRSETVRRALKEQYSVIEECKADILGIYFVPYFEKVFSSTKEDIARHYTTFVAGLFRSIRFGIEEAHGLANLIQLNFLTDREVIQIDHRIGQYSIDFEKFHKVVTELATILLNIEAYGNYEEAQKFIDTYGHLRSETLDSIQQLRDIPTDLDLKFKIDF